MTSFNLLRRASRWWLGYSSGQAAIAGLLALSLVFASTAHTAFAQTTALPTGPQVVQGNASFAQTGKQLQVTNTPGTIINWQSFGIAPGHSTYFQQQSANSSVLNQVVTNNPSQIFGTLGSNGRIVLVNPSGIVVGAGAVVDTAGFVASTLALTESNSALSRLRFGVNGQSTGTLQVDGIIRSSQGDIILIAPQVQVGAGGLVKATDGTVMLAAGQQVLLTGRGLDGIALQLQAPADQAVNLGRLEGNAIGLFASQLRNTGVIQANTAELVGGRVVLRAVDSATVSGNITAAGTGAYSRGGVVTVEGRDVQLQAATINASGTAGGGTVLIGGGWQGRDASVTNSQNTRVDASSKVDVSGVNMLGAAANAGTVVVWSDGNTRYAGQIDARGGSSGGNGGQVEVSGKENLAFGGGVRVDAPQGVGGSVLLDPKNIDISISGINVTSSVAFSDFGTTTQTIFGGNLETLVNSLAGGTLTLQATNDITFFTGLSFGPTSGSLNFEAGRSINVNQGITFATGNTANLTLFANSPNTSSTTPFRDVGLGVINMANTSGTIDMGGTATTVKLTVGNNLGGGGAITLGDISNVGSLFIDNSAVAGSSTGGILVNAASTRNITDRIFLSTQRGSIGSAGVPFSYTGSIAPLPTVIGLAAPAGSAYIRSNVPIYLGPAPELGGAAANVSGTLDLGGSTINMGARGSQFGSGAVTAGQLTYNTETVVVYSDSPNAAGPLVVNAGGLLGTADFIVSPLAKVTTSLVVGTGGINLGNALNIGGASSVVAAPAVATSLGDVNLGSLNVGGGQSGASLALNGATGALKVFNTGVTPVVQVGGGTSPNAPASVTAKTMVIGSTSTTVTAVSVLGGDGSNSSAILSSSAGNIDILGVNAVVVGSTSAQTSSYSLLQATAGTVNINGPGSTTQIQLRGGSGSGSYAEIASTVGGVNLTVGSVNLSGGVGSQAAARVVSQGLVNVNGNISTTLAGGAGSQASASITAGGAASIIGPLTLQGGSGPGSMALVSTSASITATGPITFNTSSAGTGSHALIYAGTNGIAYAIASGFTPTLAINASATAAATSGVIVPPADVGITVQLPASGLPGSTVSATVTFSNPGLVTATFTPTLSVDGVTQTFAAVTLAPNSSVTTVTTISLGGGTSTVVNASTGIASWPEVNLSNNTATGLISLSGVSDVQAFVLLPANAIAGTTVSATVTFTNTGPSSANNFTATVVVNGVTQTLTVGSIPAGGTFTTVTSVIIGTSGVVVNVVGSSTTPDLNPVNNSASASGASLLSDISSAVSLPGSAIAGTTASAVVTYTNLGSATTTFTPIIVAGGVTQTLASVTLPPAGVFTTTTTAFLVGTSSSVVTGNVGASSVPETNTINNFSSATLFPLVSDISSAVSLPGSAIAGTTASAVVTYTNLGSATTTFTPIVVASGVTQTLASVTLAPAGVFTTTTMAFLVGTSSSVVSGNVGANSVPDGNLGNNLSSAVLTPLLSDISVGITLPASASAGSSVSGSVNFLNLGGATTTFSPFIVVGGVTVTLASVTLSPGGSYTTSTLVLVGASGTSLSGGVGANSVPDANLGNNAGNAFVSATVPPPPPPPPVVTPTVVVTTPTAVTATPAVVITTPTVVVTTPTTVIPTPTVVVTTPTVVIPTPTVIVTTPTVVVTTPTVVVITPTVVVTPPVVIVNTPTVVVTTPTPTPTVVVTTPVPVPAAVPTTLGLLLQSLLLSPEQVAALPFKLSTLLLDNQEPFSTVNVLPLQILAPLRAADDVKPGDLPFCPRP